MKAERRTPIRDGGFGFREVGRAEIRGEGVPKDGRSPRLAVCHANAGSYATVESPGGGARAAVGMASRIRLAMSWSVTTARTSSLPSQRAQALTSISNVRASKVAHGTFEVAAKRSPPPMRARCLAESTFGMGTCAPAMLRARVVAETGSAAGMMGPVLSRGGGRSPAWPRGSRRSGGRDVAEGHARVALLGSFGTTRGRSFARGARTPWNLVNG